LVVTVYEGVGSNKKENHLFLYEPSVPTWRRLVTKEGAEGYGALSPDNAHVVFEFTPKATDGEKPERGRLWIVDLPSGDAKSLTVNDEDGTWDTLPSWRPDSQEISFVRCRLTTSGVITKLMHVSVKGGEASLFTDGVSDACYSPDGKRLAIMTPDGLHIWDSSTGQRTLIVPWGKLPNRKYLAVGLAWSASLDRIAFAALNQSSNQSELWIVSSGGGEPKRVYSAADGRVSFPAFVANK
jgi:Tol biopolymer transport system component